MGVCPAAADTVNPEMRTQQDAPCALAASGRTQLLGVYTWPRIAPAILAPLPTWTWCAAAACRAPCIAGQAIIA